MTPEELLKPRYKVIANYPESQCRIGDILEFINGSQENWYNLRLGKTLFLAPQYYPAIFKPLAWYEDRENEDMPQFVKHSFNGKTWVYKIAYWKINELRGYLNDTEVVSFGNVKPEYEIQPTTEAEYLTYINKQP